MIDYFIKFLSPTLLRPINMSSELHNELLTGNLLCYKDSIKCSIAVAKHAEILSHFFYQSSHQTDINGKSRSHDTPYSSLLYICRTSQSSALVCFGIRWEIGEFPVTCHQDPAEVEEQTCSSWAAFIFQGSEQRK